MYRIFSSIRRFNYKKNIRFSFENLSRIEKPYVGRVEKKRNLAKYIKNEIFPSRKKNFCVQTYRQKSENVLNLQVIRKKTGLDHPHSNKTERSGCLTN